MTVLAVFILKALSCSEHMNRSTSALEPVLFHLKALTLGASSCPVLWSETTVTSYLDLQEPNASEVIFGRVCLLHLRSLTQHQSIPWISEESCFSDTVGHQACSPNETQTCSLLFFHFCFCSFVPNKEQPQPDKEVKEPLFHLFLQRGSKCQGVKSSACLSLLQKRQQDRKCTSKALLRLRKDTKLPCHNSTSSRMSFHVFGREGIGPKLETMQNSPQQTMLKKALKNRHYLTEIFDIVLLL